MAKEQDIQKKIIKYLESLGAYVINVTMATKDGVPDLVVCYKGRFIGIEVKTPTTINDTSPLQDYNLELITKADGCSLVAGSVEDVVFYLNTKELL